MSGRHFAVLIIVVGVGVPLLIIGLAQLLVRVGLWQRGGRSRRRRVFLVVGGIYAVLAVVSFVGTLDEPSWLLWAGAALVTFGVAWYEDAREDRSHNRG